MSILKLLKDFPLTFPKRQTLDSSKLKELQTTISNLMKITESSPNG